MPGTPSNTNALKHGLRLRGSMSGVVYVDRAVRRFRVALEAAVVDARGELDTMAQATVQTAAAYFRHSMLAARWLRIHDKDLNHDQRLKYSEAVARALADRDRAMQRLGLDKSTANVWDVLSTPIEAAEPLDAAVDVREATATIGEPIDAQAVASSTSSTEDAA
jgi:hypothetical protein